jgi:ABC-2 type transport system ATP-binding protein
MDLLMGFRKVSSGTIEIFGEDPHAMARSHRKDVVFLSQEVSLKGSLTIREFLRFHSSFYDLYDHQRESELLKSFKLKENVKIGSLSTGQQRKAQVVAGFSCASKLILIDEITAVMDPETRSVFFRELHHNRERYGATILLATNIAEDLVERCDRIVFIEKKSAKIFMPDEIARLFNLAGAAA